MISTLLSTAAVVVIVGLLCSWRAGMRRRNARSWDSLVARLQPDWSASELSSQSFWNVGQHSTLEEKWNLLQGVRGIWTMYENTSVMMEMADYATQNSDSVNREILDNLRNDAMQIRQYVLMVIVQYAFSQLNESVCMDAYRAASMYIEIATRIAQLLQDSTGDMLPEFVAAM